jgi:hypothetical protein
MEMAWSPQQEPEAPAPQHPLDVEAAGGVPFRVAIVR